MACFARIQYTSWGVFMTKVTYILQSVVPLKWAAKNRTSSTSSKCVSNSGTLGALSHDMTKLTGYTVMLPICTYNSSFLNHCNRVAVHSIWDGAMNRKSSHCSNFTWKVYCQQRNDFPRNYHIEIVKRKYQHIHRTFLLLYGRSIRLLRFQCTFYWRHFLPKP